MSGLRTLQCSWQATSIASSSRTFSTISKTLPRKVNLQPPVARPARSQQYARGIQTSRPLRARYERFDSPKESFGGSSGPTPPHNGRGPWDAMRGYFYRRVPNSRARILLGAALGGSVIYVVSHIETVEQTGRWRFMDTSVSTEVSLGLQAKDQTLKQYSGKILSPHHPQSKRVHKIATRIIESSHLGKVKGGDLGAVEARISQWGVAEPSIGDVLSGQGFSDEPISKDTEWEVFVIDDKTTNAFVVPGGKIFVFTGILPVAANDDGLATIMGHEIAHQVLRHTAERVSFAKILMGVAWIVQGLLGMDYGITQAATTLALEFPQSRTAESEADKVGLHLMSRACYDPSEAPRVWQRMSEIEKTSVPAFLSTHPSNKNRFKVGPFCKAFLHHTDTISIADGRVAARGTINTSCFQLWGDERTVYRFPGYAFGSN